MVNDWAKLILSLIKSGLEFLLEWLRSKNPKYKIDKQISDLEEQLDEYTRQQNEALVCGNESLVNELAVKLQDIREQLEQLRERRGEIVSGE